MKWDKLKCLEKNIPQCHFGTINSAVTALGSNFDLCIKNLVTG